MSDKITIIKMLNRMLNRMSGSTKTLSIPRCQICTREVVYSLT